MRARVIVSLALAVACSAGLAYGQEKKGKGKAGQRLGVFSPTVYAVEPNIDAVLMLTDEQKEKVDKAIQETVKAPALLELQPKKGDPVDKEKQAKFKEEMAKAKAELKKRTDEILTTDQKATIQKIDAAIQSALDNALTKEQKEKLAGLKKPKKGK
jgi:hypothetical protein